MRLDEIEIGMKVRLEDSYLALIESEKGFEEFMTEYVLCKEFTKNLVVVSIDEDPKEFHTVDVLNEAGFKFWYNHTFLVKQE